MNEIFILWASIMLVLSAVKVLSTPTPAHSLLTLLELLAPYCLATIAPLAGYALARACFPEGPETLQPQTRLSRWGAWRKVDLLTAKQDAAYGPTGIVTTILIGLLLNILIRTAEFSVAVPAMNSTAPQWGQMIMIAMSMDLAILNFFYMVCFVMAIRGVPLFPRMLVFTWLLDLQMQLAIAKFVSTVPPPDSVATALVTLLDGNLHKVLISACLWLPVLILSRRINITYRLRERI